MLRNRMSKELKKKDFKPDKDLNDSGLVIDLATVMDEILEEMIKGLEEDVASVRGKILDQLREADTTERIKILELLVRLCRETRRKFKLNLHGVPEYKTGLDMGPYERKRMLQLLTGSRNEEGFTPKQLAAYLKILREATGKKQGQISKECGIAQSGVSLAFNGKLKKTSPHFERLEEWILRELINLGRGELNELMPESTTSPT